MALLAADLNGDGRCELISANAGSDDLAILSATRLHGLSRVRRVALGASPQDVTVGDLDGDGRLDVVAACVDPSCIVVVPGDGSGDVLVHPIDGTPSRIEVGDLNSDARPDVVLIHAQWGAFVLDNLGSLQFAPQRAVRTGSLSDLAVGDLDNDGDADLVIGTQNGPVYMYLNVNGTLQAQPSLFGGTRALKIADMDLDGDADIASIETHYLVSLYVNEGDATFPSRRRSFSSELRQMTDFVVTNVDANPNPDVIVTSWNEGISTEILPNVATLQYERSVLVDTGDEGTAVAGGDFDGDGDGDIAVCHASNGTVSASWNSGGAAFPPMIRSPVEVPRSVLPVDLEGDGDVDLLVNSDDTNELVALRNDGTGRFVPDTFVIGVAPTPSGLADLGASWNNEAPRIFAMALADVNLDGAPDIVTSHEDVLLAVRRGTGNGTFLSPAYQYQGQSIRDMSVGDMDGDGDVDVVGAIHRNSKVRVFTNNSEGAFAPGLEIAASGVVDSVRATDLDLDGALDIVWTMPGMAEIQVAWNGGLGVFSVESFPAPAQLGPFDIGDLDADGLPDIVAGVIGDPDSWPRRQGSGACVLRNTGARSFNAGTPVLAGRFCTSIQIADMDGDGEQDVLSTFEGSNNLGVFLGDGQGRLTEAQQFLCGGPTGGSTQGFACADFSGDGAIDVSICNPLLGAVSTLLNTHAPPHLSPADVDGDGYASGSDFSVLAVHFGESVSPGAHGDLNGDGVVDIRDFLIFAAGFGCGP